uniref:restriction endonuclease subunit S n=1 Tax=uncultured Halomonas sp. TaxID=173971 RepID=UPI002612F0D0|nr:restriction endonuclease subunit S [uncultured Halomonas sp.]
MSNYPELVPLDALVSDLRDGTHGTHERTESGVPFLSAKNITDSGHVSWDDDDDKISESEYRALNASFSLEPNDLLLTIVGSLGRRAVFLGEKVTFQRSVAYIRPRKDKVDPGYLFYAIGHESFRQTMVRRSNATAQAGLYLGELAKIHVGWFPISEQRFIAHILDTLDTQIQKTEALIAKLEKVKEGLLHDMLTRGIDENGRLRHSPEQAPELYKNSPFGLIPRSWSSYLCRDLFRLSSGKPRTKADIARRRAGTIPVYGGNGINGQTGDHLVASPTIVIGRVGENCGTVHRTWGKAWITDNALYATWISPEINIDFLYRYLDWHQLSSLQVATGQPLMTQSVIAEQLVGIPQRAEQIKISEALFRLERRIANENTDLAKLRSTKLGVIEDLLTGRVRVTPLLEQAQATTPA